MNAGPDTSVEPAVRDVPVFPETKPLDDLLAELQRQRSSIGVVSDEYGRTVGIVTVEDILEEVVGEIEDETDPRAARCAGYRRGLVRPRPRSLGDLEDVGIQLPVSSDAFNSIGGYVFSELGRLPKRGDRSSPTATRSGSSRCAKTGSSRCGSTGLRPASSPTRRTRASRPPEAARTETARVRRTELTSASGLGCDVRLT